LKAHCKLVLVAFLVSLIAVSILAGCGGPSVAGVYFSSSFPDFRLDLKSDGTYVQKVNDLEPQKDSGPLMEVTVKTYRGTFTVNNKRVVLNGEPNEMGQNSFKIVGRNLKGPYGLWVRQPAAKK
jgi:hypothetical protein